MIIMTMMVFNSDHGTEKMVIMLMMMMMMMMMMLTCFCSIVEVVPLCEGVEQAL